MKTIKLILILLLTTITYSQKNTTMIEESNNTNDTIVEVTKRKWVLLHVNRMSAQYQFIAEPNEPIYISCDSGNTWRSTGIIENWSREGMIGSDGESMIAFTKDNKIWESKDFGNTWKLRIYIEKK